MARPISQRVVIGRPPVSRELARRELILFRPPKGVDVISPLSAVPPEYSPMITNMVLDRGVLRSRWGIETYHANVAGERIRLTTDLVGSELVADTTVTSRSTAGLSSSAGWTDTDGVSDGSNSIVRSVGQPSATLVGGLVNDIGDPTIGSNVDAFDDLYAVQFVLSADASDLFQDPSPAIHATVSAEAVLQASTDGGVSWVTVGDEIVIAVARATASVTFSRNVVVSGSPVHVKFRLNLTVSVHSGFPVASGSGLGTVSVFSGSWPFGAFPITWSTSSAQTSAPTPRIPIRWTETRIQTYDDVTEVGSSWSDIYTFPANQLNSDNLMPTYVTWKDTLVSTDVGNKPQAGVPARVGSKGLVSTLLSLPHTTTILTHSPRAAHIAIFGNRIVASRVNEWTGGTDPWVEAPVRLSRLRWCVKDNNNDWDGLGSGFEDLYVPGSHTDEVMGAFPVNDETAIVVSERSVRRMDVTGFFDAPFRLTLLTQSLGTLSRYSIRSIPGGVVFLSYDDVVVFSLSEVRRIGTRALRDSLKAITNPRLAYGFYDQYNSRYRVAFMEGSSAVVWEYSFLDDGWTKLNFPFEIASIDRTYYTVNSVRFYGAYLTMLAASGYSCRENAALSADVDVSGTAADSPLEVRTGVMVVDSPLKKTELVELQLLYESAATQTLIFEYSTDGGASWLPYSTKIVSATLGPAVLSLRRTLETSGLQLRMRSTTLGRLKVISLHAFVIPGGMVRP